MTRQHDTQTLVESFSTLADEVQNLIDRRTILEHKLRFAAEQYQQLADKYAPTAPEVSETLANLQVPPDLHTPSLPSSYVPLPKRGQAGCNQHQIALLIRDGRRAAQQLTASTDTSGDSSKNTSSGTPITTMSTIMEQDFTVEGKKGVLDCPFSATRRDQRDQQAQQQQQQLEQQQKQSSQPQDDAGVQDESAGANTEAEIGADPTPHHSTDPICAAMFEEATSQHAPSSVGAARCPIRFLDQHSPEEVAHYVETHKHQLPRSHAICLRRYNKNEEQIRKIDAKYGDLVNMISGLGQFHQPMLATAEHGPGLVDDADRATHHFASNERVKTWANGVSASSGETGPNHFNATDDTQDERRGRRSLSHSPVDSPHESSGSGDEAAPDGENTDLERESHFDRPLKEVRLGESPSRPWGIAVPISSLPDAEIGPPLSPPAAPVRMPSPIRVRNAVSPVATAPAGKCPFDHTKFGLNGAAFPSPHGGGHMHDREETGTAPGGGEVEDEEHDKASAQPMAAQTERPYTPLKPKAQATPQLHQAPPSYPALPPQPAFVNFPPQATAAATETAPKAGPAGPQMVFTGPVFIGYPIEQAMQFMQHFQNQQGR